MPNQTNQDVAIDSGLKFEFYLVALTFTVLAFAVQSGKITGTPLPDVLEGIAWHCLFISGVTGLSRLEYLPVMYRTRHQLSKSSDDALESTLTAMHEKHIIKYRVQKWTLIVGIALLGLARLLQQYIANYS